MGPHQTAPRRGLPARTTGIALLLALGIGLAGCSGGTTGAGGSTSSVAAPERGTAAGAVGAVKAAPAPAKADGVGRVPVQTRAVISTGTVTLVSRDLGAARTDLDRLLGRYGGYVAGEQTTSSRHGRPVRSTLQLRLPSSAFDTVMNAFSGIGTVTSSRRQSEDVTTQVIDVRARLTTQRDSIRTLRRFLTRATNVEAMIRLESEIATREAALESLQAQQRYLDDQTSMATIDLTMTRRAGHAAPPPPSDTGFLSGLAAGWTALLRVGAGALTVVGAVLPFGALLVLLGAPAWLLVRRATRRRTTPTAAPTES